LGTGTASATAIIPAKTKPVSLAGFLVPAHGYLILRKPQIKLSLKNVAGGLLLYGPNGAVADRASFAGAAPEGKSFSRVSYGDSLAQHFIFTEPTPGMANAKVDDAISSNNYPIGVPLNAQAQPTSLTPSVMASPGVIALCTALIIATLFFYVFHKNKNLSNFFFGGDEAPR
jgi:hypothetical protein